MCSGSASSQCSSCALSYFLTGTSCVITCSGIKPYLKLAYLEAAKVVEASLVAAVVVGDVVVVVIVEALPFVEDYLILTFANAVANLVNNLE